MATSSTSASNLTDSYQNMEMPFSATNIIRSPVSSLLEYMRHRESQGLINDSVRDHLRSRVDNAAVTSNAEQVAISIVSAGEQQLDCSSSSSSSVGQRRNTGGQNQISVPQVTDLVGRLTTSDSRPDRPVTDNADGMNEGIPHTSNSDVERDDAARVGGASNRDASYHRHYIQQATRWIEQVLPFSLLLLLIFIRQHLQGFFIIIWISAVMFKSNDIIRKQTSLKGEKKTVVLMCYSLIFMVHVVAVHWWYWNDNLLHPMIMVPPKAVPPFWHAVFIIMVNGLYQPFNFYSASHLIYAYMNGFLPLPRHAIIILISLSLIFANDVVSIS